MVYICMLQLVSKTLYKFAVFVKEQPSGISVGQCVPEACSQDDISELNKLLLPDNQFAMADCPQKLSYSAADIALM